MIHPWQIYEVRICDVIEYESKSAGKGSEASIPMLVCGMQPMLHSN